MPNHALRGSYNANPWADISAFSNHLLHHHNIEDLQGAMEKLYLFPSFKEISLFFINDYTSIVTELKIVNRRLSSRQYSISELSRKVKDSIVCGEILVSDLGLESDENSMWIVYVPIPFESICLALVIVEGLALSEELRMAFKAIASILAIWIRPLMGKYVKNDFRSIEENLAKLSKRQYEIFTNMTSGLTNLEIAVLIGFSESLVKSETVQIFQKLGISGRRDPILEEYLAKLPLVEES